MNRTDKEKSEKMEGIVSNPHIPPLKHAGGRPTHRHLKTVLHGIMKELKVADVHYVRKSYSQQTGIKANYLTSKKYLDQLVADDTLRCEVVSDNRLLVKAGTRKQRRRLYLYRLNAFFH